MRTLLAGLLLSTLTLTATVAQSGDDRMVGTWKAAASCRHGDGETLTLQITRDATGALKGATDWARSSSDGKHGPVLPFTTMTVEGNVIKASTTADGRTIRLNATVDGDTIKGGWQIDGGDDPWTFKGRKQVQ
ncbi:MAG TPA: hypothetical protein VMF13_04160 [Luteitalea sp.]|nr:hypothetical protein [Luteitalea sp.]